MTMEIWRGKAVDVKKPEEKGPMTCKVGRCTVKVHADVERSIIEGEEVVVAGPKDDDEVLTAIAVHNLDSKSIRYVDASNYVLALGVGGFLALLGFVLGIQYKMDGNSMMASLNLLMALSGVGVMTWALSSVLKVKRAAGWVRFVD